MSGLSQDAERIFEEAREGFGPSAAERAKVHSALVATLGAGALAGTAGTAAGQAAAATAAAAATVQNAGTAAGIVAAVKGSLLAKATIVVAITGSGAMLATQPWQEPAQAPAPKTTLSVEAVTPIAPLPEPEITAIEEPEVVEPAVEAEVVAPEPKARKRRTTPVRKTGSLADEIKLIQAAEAARRAGKTKLVLSTLAKHRKQFPKGVMVAEREATWAIALCEAGRTQEGMRRARRFLKRYQGSPLAARVRSKCLP